MHTFITTYCKGEDYNVPGFVGQRAVIHQMQLVYEFGTAEEGYFDDTIHVSVLTKQIPGSSNHIDHDGAIVGGTGRFLGATGERHADVTFLPGASDASQGVYKFRVGACEAARAKDPQDTSDQPLSARPMLWFT